MLIRKGLDPQVVDWYLNLYTDNLLIVIVNNIQCRCIANNRMSVRQGDKLVMELFSLGIDPILDYLHKCLKGILIHSSPRLCPLLQHAHPPQYPVPMPASDQPLNPHLQPLYQLPPAPISNDDTPWQPLEMTEEGQVDLLGPTSELIPLSLPNLPGLPILYLPTVPLRRPPRSIDLQVLLETTKVL